MLKIALVGIVAVLAALQFKNGRSEFGVMISITGCILIFSFSVGKIGTILETIHKIESYLSLHSSYITILLKIIGITYIAEFSSDLCKDAGHVTLGNQIEFAAKLTIMAISMPILLSLLETIAEFMQA